MGKRGRVTLTGHNQRPWNTESADILAARVVTYFDAYRKSRRLVARFMPILPEFPGKFVMDAASNLDRAVSDLKKVAQIAK